MRQCLFCNNNADDREHLWPQWVLERLPHREAISHSTIGQAQFTTPKGVHTKVMCVCRTCNNGWMSRLEDENVPVIGSLLQDIALVLDGYQQYQIALWAMKSAMVSEFVSRRHRNLFYSQAERQQLRAASNIPFNTSIWIARHSGGTGVGCWGTDGWSLDRRIHSYVHTLLVGHLAIQSITSHTTPDYSGQHIAVTPQQGPAPWENLLTPIWPTTVSATWPPNLTFKENSSFSLFRLIRRYSYGEKLWPPD